MIGMSFGTGSMLLAAADSGIRDKVRVLATFGGYYGFAMMDISLTGVYEYGEFHGFVKWIHPYDGCSHTGISIFYAVAG